MKKEVLDMRLRLLQNSLGEDAKAYYDELKGILEAMNEDTEKEYSAEDLKKAAEDAFDKLFKAEELPAEVAEKLRKVCANAVEVRMKEITNTINATSKELPMEVRNQVAEAIMSCKNKSDIKDAVMAVVTKNGISGLAFEKVIDYAIVDRFEDEDELYAALNVTPIDEWFYTTQQLNDKNLIAKLWGDNSTGEKKIQQITTTPVTISPDYVYSRQEATNKLLTNLRKKGQEANFVAWLTNELRKTNHASQIRAILVGDNVNDSADKITCFETIKRSVSDIHVSVATAAEANGAAATLEEVRALRDELRDNGVETWAVMSRKQLTALAAYKYAAGGTTHYKSREEVAGEIGVDKVYLSDAVVAANGVHVILIQPKEYFVNRDDIKEIAFPKWEVNKQEWLYEEFTGGKIHGLQSCGVILSKPSTSVSGSASRSHSASASA